MFTLIRKDPGGYIDSVVRFYSLREAKNWANVNGHVYVKSADANKAMRSGAPTRMMLGGRVTF